MCVDTHILVLVLLVRQDALPQLHLLRQIQRPQRGLHTADALVPGELVVVVDEDLQHRLVHLRVLQLEDELLLEDRVDGLAVDLTLGRGGALVRQQRDADVRVCGAAEVAGHEVSGLDDVHGEDAGLLVELQHEVDGAQALLLYGLHGGLPNELPVRQKQRVLGVISRQHRTYRGKHGDNMGGNTEYGIRKLLFNKAIAPFEGV